MTEKVIQLLVSATDAIDHGADDLHQQGDNKYSGEVLLPAIKYVVLPSLLRGPNKLV